MTIEQQIRSIMPILMEKTIGRLEKEKHIKDLVLRVARMSWDNGHTQAYKEWRDHNSKGWHEWEKQITE